MAPYAGAEQGMAKAPVPRDQPNASKSTDQSQTITVSVPIHITTVNNGH
jgi:hypothetical protein